MRKIDLTLVATSGLAGDAFAVLASALVSVLVAAFSALLIVLIFTTIALVPLVWLLGQLIGETGLADLSPLLIPIKQLSNLFFGGFSAHSATPGLSANAALFLPCLLVGVAYLVVFWLGNLASRGVRSIACIAALAVMTGSIIYFLAVSAMQAPWNVLAAAALAPTVPGLLVFHPEITGDLTNLIVVIQIVPSAILMCSLLPEGFAIASGLASSREYRKVFLDSLARKRVRSLRFLKRAIMPAAMIFVRSTIVCVGLALLAVLGVLGLFIGVEQLLRHGGKLFPLFDWLEGIARTFAAFGMAIGQGGAFAVLITAPIVMLSALGWAINRALGRGAPLLREWTIVGSAAVVIGVIVLKDAEFVDGCSFVFITFQTGMLVLALRGIIWRGLKSATSRSLDTLQATVEDVRDLAQLRPILLLRAFKDDERRLGRRWSIFDLLMGGSGAGPRFEEVLAQRAFAWRPMLALGNPHSKFQLFGALKRSVSDDAWQNEVAYWNQNSAYTVMIGNKTENLAWEIEHIRETGRQRSTIYVLTSRRSGRQFFSHHALFPNEGAEAPSHNALVVFYDDEWGWTELASNLRTGTAFSIAVDMAIARKEREIGGDRRAP
ncbi:MAG: hypothetical protein QM773_01615 [Hyphomonadaceae bacterium]